MTTRQRTWQRFGALFGMGALGVLSLLPITISQLQKLTTLNGAPLPPLPVLVAASLIQPLLLLALAVATGVRLAPRLNLRSHVAAWAGGEPPSEPRFRAQVRIAVGLGILTALVILALDHFMLPTLGEAGQNLRILQKRTAWEAIMSVLYGGITEELLMRWGLATFFAWAIAKIGKTTGSPTAGTMWAAVVLAALLFGAGHLPAVMGMGLPLTAPVIARTVVLNAIAGIVFGWLYFRRSLEAGMLAHATVHLTWTGLSLLV
ncbi:CPBP family intramembrane glutamic endopeptidase [Polyangium sp. y55x31]|uniref:CPBP family intramembrane glutamic endopeptidase n=1 Tax=Polyangium sp. y55x31 TaxID=3042688 RepID=UPI002482192D|nr:CPBP family intramembrane glutamic endopeptidase [Polyangium sp. y55x31]MDI1475572.1 CPBP family intramembrane metalloprotease [Polyangium sp. y55x31]